METLIACPACHLHARAHERDCPRCGAPLRAPGGRVAPTSVAVLMGLTLMGCGDAGAGTESSSNSAAVSTGPETATLYGVPSTSGGPAPATSTASTDSEPATSTASTDPATSTSTADTTTPGSSTGDCETASESDSGCETEGDAETEGGTETGGDTATTGPTTGGQPLYGAAETADP